MKMMPRQGDSLSRVTVLGQRGPPDLAQPLGWPAGDFEQSRSICYRASAKSQHAAALHIGTLVSVSAQMPSAVWDALAKSGCINQGAVMGAAAYVGRVGGLAVALGVGVAIATGQGIAWADTGDPSSSTSGTSSASGSTDSSTPESTQTSGKSSTTTTTVTSATESSGITPGSSDPAPER